MLNLVPDVLMLVLSSEGSLLWCGWVDTKGLAEAL